MVEFRAAAHPNDLDAQASSHARIGSIRRQQGRLEEALPELRRAVELRPDKGEFHERYANALTGAGRLAEAEREYRTALELGAPPGKESAVRRNFAVMLLQAHRPPEAVEQARRAVELQASPANHEALAFTLMQAGRLDDAVETLEAAVIAHPGDSSLQKRLAQLRNARAR